MCFRPEIISQNHDEQFSVFSFLTQWNIPGLLEPTERLCPLRSPRGDGGEGTQRWEVQVLHQVPPAALQDRRRQTDISSLSLFSLQGGAS